MKTIIRRKLAAEKAKILGRRTCSEPGANTPWYLTRLTRGGGTSTANFSTSSRPVITRSCLPRMTRYKNITLQREPRVRLAPAYDLVCTRAWNQLSKQLAFAVGGVRDAGNVTTKAWATFASAASLSKKLVVEEAAHVARVVSERADETAERAISGGANATAVRNAVQHVKASSARATKLLSASRVSVFQRANPKPISRGGS